MSLPLPLRMTILISSPSSLFASYGKNWISRPNIYVKSAHDVTPTRMIGASREILVPGSAVALDERNRGRRPPGSRDIGPRRLARAIPGFTDRIDPAPGGLHLVTAHEQRLVASDHIHDEAFIGLRHMPREGLGEAHVEGHMLEAHATGPRLLDHEPELDPLVRLEPDDQPIGRYRVRASVEDRVRDGAEGNLDIGYALRQAFARA